MKLKTIKSPSLILILFLLIVWIGLVRFYAWKDNPINKIKNYQEFRNYCKKPLSSKILIHKDKTYYELQKEMGLRVLILPSGPPAYIFDNNGQLIDWSIDIFEDSEYEKKWGKAKGRLITIEELDKILLKNL